MLLLALCLPVNCLAGHSVKLNKKLCLVELGSSKDDIKKLMGVPDDAIGTLKGIQIWKYDINRYRTSLEKSDVFLVGLLIPVLGWIVCTILPEENTYCFYFTNDGTLLQWGQRDDWQDIKKQGALNY
jgi:hypothetical protein